MDDAFTKPWEDVTEYFRVDPERGLAMEQVRSYQEKYGPNGKKIWNFWNIKVVKNITSENNFDGLVEGLYKAVKKRHGVAENLM